MKDFAKAHVPGYSKKDGTYVRPHERGGEGGALSSHYHPRVGEGGKLVTINRPHHPSAPSTWHNPDAVATFVPGGDVPTAINGVPVRKWRDHPTTVEGWDYCDGVNPDLVEPAFTLPPGKRAASGVVVEESDGRVWVIAPTNAFGGYEASFPKGSAEPELSLQGNAIKEAWEESGLHVQIVDFLVDVERTTSKARFYRAKRLGGDPTACGWETQAVMLVPRDQLYEHLNMSTDHVVAEAVGAGPAPLPKKKYSTP